MKNISSPIIYEVDYSNNDLATIEDKLENKQHEKYILRFPTVYIVNNEENNQEYSVYIGETTDIKRRTAEHLQSDTKSREDWEALSKAANPKMFVIGHEHFNKSLTLDIENKLMHYLSSVSSVKHVYNRRTNEQMEYYTSDEMEIIFSKIWRKLRQKNKALFPIESVIRDSALFKASPFHKLTDEQIQAKDQILMKIEEALNRNRDSQLILVNGEAGSGKTVLMSNLFYDLFQLSKPDSENVILRDSSQYLLVNHDQQLKVYEQLSKKLGISSKKRDDLVGKPTSFITKHSPEEKVDVVIVDEAHLLWTQGKQAYRGENQLQDLLDRARVVVAVFDQNQVLSREQYWEEELLTNMIHQAQFRGNYIELKNQMRINASVETVQWIRHLIDEQEVKSMPQDTGYQLKVFESPEAMYQQIKQDAQDQEAGISRMLATFDWEYVNQRKPKDSETWNVSVGDFSLPWNLQLEPPKEQKRKNSKLSWAEQAHTIDEVGSTFTIQGFDLNYAGVIIGPSVKYRDGKLVFDRTASKNKKAVQQRSTKNGKKYVSDTLLKNELNVLLTRGVNGLYLFAVDEALQAKLLEVQAAYGK